MAQDRIATDLANLPEHGFDGFDFILRKRIDLDTVVSEDLSLKKGARIQARRLDRVRQEFRSIQSLSAQ